jgi:hypothetical protein
MTYRQLMNSFDLTGLDLLQVDGEIDFSNATLVGFPVDNLTIRVNEQGVLEVRDGSITIAKVTGTDLWTRILSDESNIATLLSRTQYQSAAGNVTSFTGTVSVAAITLNSADLGTRLTNIESVNATQGANISTLQTKTQYQSASGNITTFTGTISVPAITLNSVSLATTLSDLSTGILNINYRIQGIDWAPGITDFDNAIYVPAIRLAGVDLNTRITSIETLNTTQDSRLSAVESVNTTQSSNISTLQLKTQFLSAPGVSTICASNFLPSTDSTYTLGSAAAKWQQTHTDELYVTSIPITNYTGWLSVGTTIVPSTTNTYDLGTTVRRWRTLVVQSITLNANDLNTRLTNIESTNTTQDSNITALQTKTQYQTASASITSWNCDLNPTADNLYDLGSPTFEWKRIYTHELFVDSIAFDTVAGDLSIGATIIPAAAVTYDLGTTLKPWRRGYFTNITLGTVGDLATYMLPFAQVSSILAKGGIGAAIGLYLTGHLYPMSNNTYTLGTNIERWSNVHTTALQLAGVDLNTRITAIESVNTTQNTNITTLQTKTQYQTAAANVTTFTGTIAVPAITLNAVDLNTRITSIESVNTTQNTNITTLQTKTQYQTAAANITTFTGTIAVPAITLNAVDLNTRITSIESVNTTQNTNITTLQTKTQYQSATGNVTSFTGSVSVPTVTASTLAQSSGTLTAGLATAGSKLLLNHGTGIADCVEITRTVKNKKLALYESVANEHQFYGFGVNAGVLRFQTDSTTSTFDFFQATSASASNQIARIGTASYHTGTLYATGNGCFGGTDVTSAGLSIFSGPNDGAGDTLLLNLYAGGGNGAKLTMRGYTGGITTLNSRIDNTFKISHSVFAPAIVLSATGFQVLNTSYAEKASGNVWSNPSDSRIKKNIIRDKNKLPGLKEINQLELTQWEFNDDAESRDDKNHIGFIADEVAKVFPNSCIDMPHKKFGTIKGLDCSDLLMALFPAVQELSAKLDTALARIKVLEEEVGFEPDPKRVAL